VFSLLRFIAQRLLNGRLAKTPFVRRLLLIAALLSWLNKKFGASTQQVKLRRGETLLVSVVKDKEASL
jgi:hypothetical protein